jgi:uncharacterized NAD(P)/FAD-binding protein YdhS
MLRTYCQYTSATPKLTKGDCWSLRRVSTVRAKQHRPTGEVACGCLAPAVEILEKIREIDERQPTFFFIADGKYATTSQLRHALTHATRDKHDRHNLPIE